MRKFVNGQYVDMTQEEIEELENSWGGVDETNPSGIWRTVRNFSVPDEEGAVGDTESNITWTVNDEGYVTAFKIDSEDNGVALNAQKMRICIYPQNYETAVFSGTTEYLNVICNGYNSNIYNATKTLNGYRLETEIIADMSGVLRQIVYMGADRNSYGNEKPHITFFYTPGKGYGKPPIENVLISVGSGTYFVPGAQVKIQVYEETW